MQYRHPQAREYKSHFTSATTTTSHHSRGGHSWSSGHKNVQYVEKHSTAFHRARGSYPRGGNSHGRNRVSNEMSSTDHHMEINYIPLDEYLHIKDFTFCNKQSPRHKIACRSAYFPEEKEENQDRGATSSEESDEVYPCDSGVYDELVDSKRCPLTPLLDDDSLEIASNNCMEQPKSCEYDSTINLNDDISASVSFDALPSTSDTTTDLCLMENANSRKTANSFRCLSNVQSHLLPDLISRRLNESSENYFIVFLQALDIPMLRIVACDPTRFVVCINCTSPEFLMDSDVKFLCHSMGMMLNSFKIFRASENNSQVVWILTFAHLQLPLITTTPDDATSNDLEDLMASYFNTGHEVCCINIIHVVY